MTFPELLTDLVARVRPEHRREPLAVVEARSGGVRVAAANAPAREGGVSRGMTLTEARARLSGLVARTLPPGAVAEALARLGDWAHRFGPGVGVIPSEEERPPAVAVEVGGSAQLFGGEAALAGRAVGALARAGYGAAIAVAGTLGAAFAVAAYGPRRGEGGVERVGPPAPAIVASGDEMRAIAGLPLEALRLPADAVRRLARLGVRTAAALAALPRASVARRFGAGVLRRLGEALGEVPEPLALHRPAASFRGRIELPEPDDRSETLLAALGRLLEDAQAWLLARGEGARRLRATLAPEEGAPLEVEVALGAPRRDRRRLERLFRARLESVPSPGRLAAVELRVLETAAQRARQLEAFAAGAEGVAAETAAELVDRLVARLGEPAVLRAVLAEDARPERGYRLLFATRAGGPGAGAPRSETATGGGGSRAPPLTPEMRPVRLFAPPRPAGGPPPRLLRGPERIATGWWEGEAPARDYWVAEDAQGRRVLAYEAAGAWFVHGMF
jgi:protein ImuB